MLLKKIAEEIMKFLSLDAATTTSLIILCLLLTPVSQSVFESFYNLFYARCSAINFSLLKTSEIVSSIRRCR